jgi:hypothetical protein
VKIWKFPLVIIDHQTVEMPFFSTPLAVQMQHGELMLWALVEPTSPLRPKKFAVHGTGHSVPAGEKYIGTAQMAGGELVWHVFEVQ